METRKIIRENTLESLITKQVKKLSRKGIDMITSEYFANLEDVKTICDSDCYLYFNPTILITIKKIEGVFNIDIILNINFEDINTKYNSRCFGNKFSDKIEYNFNDFDEQICLHEVEKMKISDVKASFYSLMDNSEGFEELLAEIKEL